MAQNVPLSSFNPQTYSEKAEWLKRSGYPMAFLKFFRTIGIVSSAFSFILLFATVSTLFHHTGVFQPIHILEVFLNTVSTIFFAIESIFFYFMTKSGYILFLIATITYPIQVYISTVSKGSISATLFLFFIIVDSVYYAVLNFLLLWYMEKRRFLFDQKTALPIAVFDQGRCVKLRMTPAIRKRFIVLYGVYLGVMLLSAFGFSILWFTFK